MMNYTEESDLITDYPDPFQIELILKLLQEAIIKIDIYLTREQYTLDALSCGRIAGNLRYCANVLQKIADSRKTEVEVVVLSEAEAKEMKE